MLRPGVCEKAAIHAVHGRLTQTGTPLPQRLRIGAALAAIALKRRVSVQLRPDNLIG
jgi:hypothetical protein